MAKGDDQSTLPSHGASVLPSVRVESYNVEAEDDDGFIGDKASKGAFWEIFDKWREPLRKISEDPFGDMPTEKITKKELETALAEGEPEAAALVQSAVEEFAQQLAKVIRRLRKLKAWSEVECVAMGGGFRGSRIGELAISRCALLLRADEIPIDVEMIANDPHDAGLIGAAHLLPPWVLDGYDGILAVDIGGTNIRTGVVELQLEKAKDLSKARVAHSEIWRHGQEDIGRDAAVEKLTEMLDERIRRADKANMKLAPVVGIGCPGIIATDGSIERGAQNLPGNWQSSKFHLPAAIQEAIPMVGKHETIVIMHNDAVVQGLSEIPRMKKRKQWAVLTIGTGLGNASYAQREVKRKGK
jgi:hypothetical protein